MTRQIYVNLAVKNLERTKAFFGSLGFSFNPKFTNESGASMVIGDNIYAMLRGPGRPCLGAGVHGPQRGSPASLKPALSSTD
jgi:hypothetical protein